MGAIKIYGASDDLIEVEGDIREEGSGPGFVELSTGDVFAVNQEERYGVWNVDHVVDSGDVAVDIVTKAEEDDDGYTGHATVSGEGIEWVDFWDAWPPEDEQVRERLSDRLDDLAGDALAGAYRAAMGRG